MNRYALVWGLIAAVYLMAGSTTCACRIPVFRYALERWEPDSYELVLVHQGTINVEEQKLVDGLRSAISNGAAPLNAVMRMVDLNGDGSQSDAELTQIHEKSGQTVVVVRSKVQGQSSLIWSGPLNQANVAHLVHSPVRQAIVKHLLDGESSVWVLLESGNAEQDQAAMDALQSELARMQEELKLPDQEELEAEEEFQRDTAVELRIGFKVVRLKRDDPKEEVFRHVILNSEPDLHMFDEPIAIPVFGRGRTYFALVGAGINAQNIGDNCRFICGDCSCQVKAQNPGMDLLLAVNWDANISGSAMADQVLPELTGVGGLEIFDLTEIEARAESGDTNSSPHGFGKIRSCDD